MIKSTGS